MNKTELKEEMIRLQENHIKEIEEGLELAQEQMDIDEGATKDPEDFSQQYASGEMEKITENKLVYEKNLLFDINHLDFGHKNSVEPGAYVRTNVHHFIIGVSTSPFDFDDLHLVGISEKAPIYQSMKGKKAGDSFTFRDTSFTIEEIL